MWYCRPRLLFKNRDELKIKRELSVDETVCRTCLRQVTTSLIFLDKLYKQKLLLCIPELDMWAVPDIKICKNCYTTLYMTYSFKTRCLEIEETINNYLREYKIVDAEDLLMWSNCIIKTEPKDSKFENEQLSIKQEERDLDDDKRFQRDLSEDRIGESYEIHK